jgi:hypothetical protein
MNVTSEAWSHLENTEVCRVRSVLHAIRRSEFKAGDESMTGDILYSSLNYLLCLFPGETWD